MSKDNKYEIKNNTHENLDDLNDSEMMKTGEMKQSDTIGKLKDDNLCTLDSMDNNFQEKLIKMFWMTNTIMTSIMRRFCC